MEEEIGLIGLYTILKKRLGMIITLSLVGLSISFAYTFYMTTPQYIATTEILVNHSQSTEVIQQSDINTNLQLINTYKDIIKGPVILDDVREQLDLDLSLKLSYDQLSNKINLLTQADSQVFSIQATDSDPDLAVKIVDTTAETFQTQIDEIMNVDNVTIISEGATNLERSAPNMRFNLGIGFLAGLMLGIGGAIVYEFFDNTIKSPKFVTEMIGWTNLGSISILSSKEKEAILQKNTIESALDEKRV